MRVGSRMHLTFLLAVISSLAPLQVQAHPTNQVEEQSGEGTINTLEGEIPSLTRQLQSHLSADLWGNLTGGAFEHPRTPDTPSASGSSASPQGFNSADIAVRYDLGHELSIGLMQYFSATPASGSPLQLSDLALTVKMGSLIARTSFHVHNELQFIAPTSQPSQAATSLGSIKEIMILVKDLPGTKLTLGLYSVLQASAFNDALKAQVFSSDLIYLYNAPFLNYQISDQTAATIWIDLFQAHDKAGNGKWNLDDLAFKPGLSWDLSSNLRLNPYVNIYARNPSLSTTYAGIFVSMKQ